LLVFNRSDFVRNVATLFSGKVLAALISLLLVPIVARLFEPAHFGVAAIFLAIVAALGPLSTACFDLAIVLPDSDLSANKLIKLSLGVLVLFSFLIFLVLVMLYLGDFSIPFLDQVGGFSWLLPAAILLFGIINILDNWFTRKKAYSPIATSDVAQATAMPLTRISLGMFYGSSVTALIAGYFLGLIAKILLRLKNITGNKDLLIKNSNIQIKELLNEFRDFPLYSAPTRFLRSMSKSLPVLMLGFMFTPAIAGFYAMADRLVRLPADAAAMAVRRVYIQKASEYKNRNISLKKIFLKITAVLFILGILPFGVLTIYGEEIVAFILGEQWLQAGHYSEILAPWFFSIWLVTPSSALFVVYRKQKLWLNIQIFLSFLRLLVFLLAYLLKLTPDQTLTGFVTVSAIVNLSVIYVVYRLIMGESGNRVSV